MPQTARLQLCDAIGRGVGQPLPLHFIAAGELGEGVGGGFFEAGEEPDTVVELTQFSGGPTGVAAGVLDAAAEVGVAWFVDGFLNGDAAGGESFLVDRLRI